MKNLLGDRPRAERYSCGLAITCSPLSGAGKLSWVGWASDVSDHGMCLVVERRFEKGTLLRVQARTGAVGHAAFPLLRVVLVRAAGEGKWLIQCHFTRKPDEGELCILLGPAGAWLASR
jgi:hypothetical protein